MNILFVCNQNRDRSPTAEILVNNEGKHKAKSAGLYCERDRVVSNDMIKWADVVCVMEEHQRDEINKRFPKQAFLKRILCLDVPNIYKFNQSELVRLLKKKIKDVLSYSSSTK